MILVTVGTHEDPFDRLVRAAEALAGSERVVLQKGSSTVATPSCAAFATLAPAELDRLMAEARIVITHAGPTTVIEAAGHGHVPIVVPRRAEHGEHVDDHQVRFARRIADRVHVVESPENLADAIERHDVIIGDLRPFRPDARRTREFAGHLEQICERAMRAPPRQVGVRARLRALRKWMNFST